VREGAIAERVLPDGRELVVYPLTYRRARLAISDHQGADFIRNAY
jgi:hypothetical protein